MVTSVVSSRQLEQQFCAEYEDFGGIYIVVGMPMSRRKNKSFVFILRCYSKEFHGYF